MMVPVPGVHTPGYTTEPLSRQRMRLKILHGVAGQGTGAQPTGMAQRLRLRLGVKRVGDVRAMPPRRTCG